MVLNEYRSLAPNKTLQRTQLNASCFPYRSVRAAELGRSAAVGRWLATVRTALAVDADDG